MLGEAVESEAPAGAARAANVPYSERDQSANSALDPLSGPAVAAHKTRYPPSYFVRGQTKFPLGLERQPQYRGHPRRGRRRGSQVPTR
jgi:hypothetical protein